MGNQQSAGTQFCSRGQLYASRTEIASYKSSDLENRVGYHISTKQKFQGQGSQKAHQQDVPHQQGQDEIVEIPLSGSGKAKGFSDTIQHSKQEAQKVVKPDVEAEIIDQVKDKFKVFECVFGNTIINKNGLVLYTDMAGKKHCEEYDRDQIGKIFPMGISHGGLTKTIWFKDGVARDECFDLMTTMTPPTYRTVKANLDKYSLPDDKESEEDDIKVFEGINDRNVIVHAENIVLYTDITDTKHCEHYDKRDIQKCFPNGIQDGGLTRKIWFRNEMERDLCFMLMQWNMEEEVPEVIPEEPSELKFSGLCGGIVLHPDNQIEFTSFSGVRVKCFYEPSEIREVFPKGISYGRLLKTVWFRDVNEREKCFNAMRKM